MKNVFISGLAIGNECGTCACSNINVDWLFSYPSNLLWIDKVYISHPIWEAIINEQTPEEIGKGKKIEFNKATKLIFEILDSVGMVEVVNTKSLLTEDFVSGLYNT
ncbi:hypothetical protein EZS27_030492, partial [termite gut metagenome]